MIFISFMELTFTKVSRVVKHGLSGIQSILKNNFILEVKNPKLIIKIFFEKTKLYVNCVIFLSKRFN